MIFFFSPSFSFGISGTLTTTSTLILRLPYIFILSHLLCFFFFFSSLHDIGSAPVLVFFFGPLKPSFADPGVSPHPIIPG